MTKPIFKPKHFDDDAGGYGPYSERLARIANTKLARLGIDTTTPGKLDAAKRLHNAMLELINGMGDPKVSTPEGKILLTLATEVERFEKVWFPITDAEIKAAKTIVCSHDPFEVDP